MSESRSEVNYAREVVIDRSQVDPSSYDSCYIGHWARASGVIGKAEPSTLHPVSLWAESVLGYAREAAITDAAFGLDEVTAVRLFSEAGIAVTFVGEYRGKEQKQADIAEVEALYGDDATR